MLRRAAALVLLFLSACHEAQPPRAVAPSTDRGLAWIPTDTVGVARFPGRTAAMVSFVERLFTDPAAPLGLQPCFRAQVATFDEWYMLSTTPSDAVNVVRGRLDRDALERCVDEQLGNLIGPLTFERDGIYTEITSPRGVKVLAWFAPGMVAFGKSRAELASIVDGPRGPSEPLAALIRRADRGAGMWAAEGFDMTSRLTGTASSGLLLRADWPETLPPAPDPKYTLALRATVLFADAESARRVETWIHDRMHDATLEEPIRDMVRKLDPQRHDAELELDATAFFADPALAAALQKHTQHP